MYTIRAARIDELPACADHWLAMFEDAHILEAADLQEHWRERFVSYFSRRISENEARYFVAVNGNGVIGTAGAMLADGYPTVVHGLRFGYIFGVHVASQHRGQGLATALTRETIAFLKELKCRRIALHASPFGRPIYERLGFIPSNEMKLSG
jgi:ribosomal protein S18 acetylase RimI-like enzyme